MFLMEERLIIMRFFMIDFNLILKLLFIKKIFEIKKIYCFGYLFNKFYLYRSKKQFNLFDIRKLIMINSIKNPSKFYPFSI